jgi:hypothetical protein
MPGNPSSKKLLARMDGCQDQVRSSPGMTIVVAALPLSQTRVTLPVTRSRPRGAMRPSRCFIFRPFEGVGNAGCPLHPRPRVHLVVVERTRVNEYTGITRRSRTQWFYDLFRALPGDRACLPPSSTDRFCLSPVGPTQLRELDTSVGVSGPHDFAVRNNISRPLAW